MRCSVGKNTATMPSFAVDYLAFCYIVIDNKTRQGYALRSTLKPAGYFFLRRMRGDCLRAF